RQFDRRAASRQAERSQRQNAVRSDRQLGLAGERCLDEQFGGVACLVARLVERRLELVRHIRQRRLDPPADMEAQARLRAGCRIGRVTLSITARPLGSNTLTCTVTANGFVTSGRSVRFSAMVVLPSGSVAGGSRSLRVLVNSSPTRPK